MKKTLLYIALASVLCSASQATCPNTRMRGLDWHDSQRVPVPSEGDATLGNGYFEAYTPGYFGGAHCSEEQNWQCGIETYAVRRTTTHFSYYGVPLSSTSVTVATGHRASSSNKLCPETT